MLSTQSHKVGMPCESYNPQKKLQLGKSFRKFGLKTNHTKIISNLPSNEASPHFLLANCCRLAKSEGLVAKISKGKILEIWDWQELKAAKQKYGGTKGTKFKIRPNDKLLPTSLFLRAPWTDAVVNRRLGVVYWVNWCKLCHFICHVLQARRPN